MPREKRKPDPNDAQRCLELRKISKSARRELTQDESAFCLKMMKKFPKWYKWADAVVFNETRPFGSTVEAPVGEYDGE